MRETKSSISRYTILCIVGNFFLILAYILMKYFSWNDTSWLCFGYLWLFSLVATFALLFGAIYIFVSFRKFVSFRTNIKRAAFLFLPFLINGTIFLTFWLVPVHAIMSDLKFRLKEDSYKKIIQMVEYGHIQPNYKGFAELPPEYRNLSSVGIIFIDKGGKVMTVLFDTSAKFGLSFGKGITRLAGVSGYMYRSDGTPPPDPFKGLNWVYVKKIEPNWFYYDSKIPPP